MKIQHAPDEATASQYTAAGFDGGFRLGAVPALVIVDLSLGFTDPASPLGSEMPDTLARTRELVERARQCDVLTVFTTIAFRPDTLDTVAWVRKVPSLSVLTSGSRWVEIDPSLGAREQDPLITKVGASAFSGTPLQTMLVSRRVDTLLVAGASTSGCVRATVVDGVQAGFDTFVVTDCVADRARGPHEAALFDMTAKYADPLTMQEAVSYLERLPHVGEPART